MKLYLLVHGILALTMGINAETVFPKIKSVATKTMEDDLSVKSTANIFILAFLISRMITFFAWCLLLIKNRKFRKNIWYWNLSQNLSSIPYIISLFFQDRDSIRNLWLAGIIVDLIFYIMVANIIRVVKFNYRVGVNIEHITERLGLFTVIVSGSNSMTN